MVSGEAVLPSDLGMYMDTVEGRKFIANLLAMSQSGAYT